jgi:L-lactate dehydrogenase complex protein LldF
MLGLRLWAWTARRPRLYALATAVGVRLLRAMGDRHGMIRFLPFASGWTKRRFFPAPHSGSTFRALYARRRAK